MRLMISRSLVSSIAAGKSLVKNGLWLKPLSKMSHLEFPKMARDRRIELMPMACGNFGST